MRPIAASLAAAGVLLAAAAPALADTIRVPGDYDNINDAVAAAQDGDTVLVGPGTYAEDVMVLDKSNLRIRGKGGPILTPGGFAFTITNGSVVEVSGFQVEGGAGAVRATTSSGVRVTRIESTQSGDATFAFEMCAGVLLSKCEAHPANSEAVVDISSSGLVIEKCLFSPTAFPTILDLSSQVGGTAGSNGAVIAKNRFFGGGINIAFGGQGGRIEKNSFGSNGIAILLPGVTDTAGTVVSRNRVGTFGASAIECYSPSVTIERNALLNGGIVAQGDFVVLDRNSLVSTFGSAIRTAGAGVTVTGNRVLGAAGTGLFLDGGAHQVEGNRLVGTDGFGILLMPGTGGSSLVKNQVVASDGIGILVVSTPVTVTENRVSRSGGAAYADASAEGVNTLTDNKFETTMFNYVE